MIFGSRDQIKARSEGGDSRTTEHGESASGLMLRWISPTSL